MQAMKVCIAPMPPKKSGFPADRDIERESEKRQREQVGAEALLLFPIAKHVSISKHVFGVMQYS